MVGTSLVRENVADNDLPADFLSVFARSASAVNPTENNFS